MSHESHDVDELGWPGLGHMTEPDHHKYKDTNCKPKLLKPKLDIVEKPENRVHRPNNSNGTIGRVHLKAETW